MGFINWFKRKFCIQEKVFKPFNTYSDGRGGYGITPKRAKIGDAGYDFFAPREIVLKANEWTEIDTLVSFNDGISTVEDNWVMLIMPKSGLGTAYNFCLKNTIGVIDSGYRGHIKVTVKVDKDYTLKKGDKMVQGIVVPVLFFDGEETPSGLRGTGGFGSTGQ